ncbi:zinc ribbon domain-containing protein [Leptothermofonsia sichuanensis E412]|uniref:FmdB family zinc ribbon protein n=1 Tax=Leptothermofonsia sichuanensis TaxID=2917832 RepID=UPI001CA7B325|nr:zinc ribbon domain-containing protein [Leptothermofonsia sichuanensis]QZZ22360.1 zinc ribbon domain-containing protein [Leptothermofonsia sichuanensis E412]
MPLYEFKCQSCGVFEEWRSLSQSSDPAVCPTCQQPGKRVISAPAVNLSSSLSLRHPRSEPELVKRETEPKPQKFQHQSCGRPWMLNH